MNDEEMREGERERGKGDHSLSIAEAVGRKGDTRCFYAFKNVDIQGSNFRLRWKKEISSQKRTSKWYSKCFGKNGNPRRF